MAVDHNNPQSRNEEILIAAIDGKEYNKLPQSRIEELLLELKEVIEAGGGGGGGTSDYTKLQNLPTINNVTLTGEMTAADLSLVLAEVGKGLSTNDYSNEEKAKVANLLTSIQSILDGTDIDSFGDVEVALLDKADISDLGTAAAKDSTNTVTSGSTDLVESGAVKDAIDAAVSSAYHHAGTKTVAQLTHDLLVATNEGNVYNITDSGTTTSDFIEGIGKTIDEGSNVGICKVGDVYMFDLLSGFVDTTNFVQKSQTSGLLKNDGTVNEEIEGDVDTLKEDVNAIDSKIDDSTTYPYADVITIEDAIPANLAECNVKIEPVQDLHGYDKPWVGGAGKNKCAGTYTTTTNGGVTFTANSDGTVSATDTSSGYAYVNSSEFTIKAGAYIFSGAPSGNSKYVLAIYSGATLISQISNGTETSVTFESDTNIVVRCVVNGADVATGVTYKPMLRLSTETDATFAPYTNICPITGHTEVRVEVTDEDEITKTYTIALGSTIYGGTVDFDSGVMTVNRAYAEYDGTQAVQNVQRIDNVVRGQFVIQNSVSYPPAISNYLKWVNDWSLDQPHFYIYDNKINVFLPIPNDGTSTWDSYLTSNPLQVCYLLATPTTIQLTPQQIQLLKGTNTLTASTGQISVTANGVSGSIGAVQEQVNEHEERIEEVESGEYKVIASVTADGVKTYSDLFSEFFTSLTGGIERRYKLIFSQGAYTINQKGTNHSSFGRVLNYDGAITVSAIDIKSNNTAKWVSVVFAADGTATVNDNSANVPPEGTVIKLVV